MAKLEIINVPDPLLKTISEPIGQVDDDLRRLMDNMLETMYDAPGIGLAAIQVAIPKRVIVVDAEGDDEVKKPKFLVNPQVTWESEELNVYNEGCLSVPEHYAEVERPASVKVKYLDYNGKEQEEQMDGLLATCVQHEIDHLNGIVFIDYLSRLRRNMIIKKVQKATKDMAVL
ncbi:peptide deformylase [Kordiimonas marina]|uniref:peptide deformylase n=1 Tax=Kordiimonas marina TaxID=2872312 RepID=UPI001FF4CCD7|nr:peptide deformylase [Kordiimonas marina]MCJ9429927.1 peptide deformylase [Kordiimonas marina]